MNADLLTPTVADGIAVITLGNAKHIYFNVEMGDDLTETLDRFAGDPGLRVVIVTGGAPGYFNRHFDIPTLVRIAASLRASGRVWPENATYNGGFFDKAMAQCESMPKPVIAGISGTVVAGAFEFALASDLRIAEDGDYLIDLREVNLGLLPRAGGTQRLPRTIGSAAALMHILMGDPLTPQERGWCTKPSPVGLSIAQWRLHAACRHFRPSQLPSVSSVTPPRCRSEKVWCSNEIFS